MDEIVERLRTHVENSEVYNAISLAQTLSRTHRHWYEAAYFAMELSGNMTDVMTLMHADMKDYSDEDIKRVCEEAVTKFDNVHSNSPLPIAMAARMGHSPRVIFIRAGEIDSEIEQNLGMVSDASERASDREFDDPDGENQYRVIRINMRNKIIALRRIKTRILAEAGIYCSKLEKYINDKNQKTSFMSEIQVEVDSYFIQNASDIYEKINIAVAQARIDSPESGALVLTSVRRALNSVANHFYKPVSGQIRCADGEMRIMDEEHYLNRLKEFISISFNRSTEKELLTAEFLILSVFLTRLNDMASKGVHSDVSKREARQGLISLYSFLSNIIRMSEDR